LSVKEVRQKLESTLQNIRYAVSNSILFSTIVENICSSLSADNGAIIVNRCNVLALLSEAQKIFEGPAGEKDVIFEPIVKNNLDVSSIYADKTLLMRAFMNVYHNAVKYSYFGQSEDRPRRIQTACEGLDKFVKITIGNYGLGILPDEEDAIFNEGYRGKLSSDRHRTGSGLGLFQVRRIIDEQHGGKTQVESRPLGHTIDGPYVTKLHMYIPYMQEETEVT
jgi:signal transduction histidine kinase